MSKRIVAAAVMASIFGFTTSAMAGTTNAFSFFPPVATALSNPVTYSTPAMQTYIAIRVGDSAGLLMKNTSGNTANSVFIRFTATVTDSFETLKFHQPELYLPAGCTWDTTPSSSMSITCSLGQLKNGDSVPGFTFFLVAPQKVCQTVPCDSGDDVLGADFVSTALQVKYSEGQAGPPTTWDNSNQSVAQPNLVALGTFNPVNVITGVPKSGVKISTGVAGVPVPESQGGKNSQFAEFLTVPELIGKYTQAKINVFKLTDPDVPLGSVTPGNIADCTNYGHFVSCPLFETSVAQDGTETRFDKTKPLRMVYRVDASNQKMPATKILNSTIILYTGQRYLPGTNTPDTVNGPWADKPLDVCVQKDVARDDGLPCINNKKCYKKNDTGGIAEDCEWEAINTGNGFIKLQ